MAAGVRAMVTVTVGGVAYAAPMPGYNFNTIAAERTLLPFCIWVPRNQAYKVDSDNTTNLTIRIQEVLM